MILLFMAVLSLTMLQTVVVQADEDEKKIQESIRKLQNTKADIRIKAAHSLQEFVQRRTETGFEVDEGARTKAQKAIPSLVKALTDPDKKVRDAAEVTFRLVTDLPEKDVNVLRASLHLLMLKEKKDVARRKFAADGLGKLGGAARYAVPALADVLEKEEDLVTQKTIAYNLKKIVENVSGEVPQGEEAFPALLKTLEHRDPSVRSDVAYALRKIVERRGGDIPQWKEGDAVPQLVEALKDPVESVRSDILAILKELRKHFGTEIDGALRELFKEKFLTTCPPGTPVSLSPEAEELAKAIDLVIEKK